MKKMIITAAAVAMFAAPAMASKARVDALQNAAHISDSTDIFYKPSTAGGAGWATFELGTGAATTPNAEGGFVRTSGNASYGFYLGHDVVWSTGRSVFNPGTAYLAEENPFDFVYATKADMSWGVGLHMSNSDHKAAATLDKAANNSLAFSASQGAWDAHVDLGLTDTAENTAGKWTGSSGMTLGGGYWMDTMYLYADYSSAGGKSVVTASSVESKLTTTVMQLGVVETAKVEGGEFFYGASYNTSTAKAEVAATETKADDNYLAAIIGLEAEAASWLTLRASVTQDVLISSTKGAGDATSPRSDNTKVAAGAGIKWGKMVMDGTLAAAGTGAGKVDGTSLLANASFTYRW